MNLHVHVHVFLLSQTVSMSACSCNNCKSYIVHVLGQNCKTSFSISPNLAVHIVHVQCTCMLAILFSI